MWQREAQAEAPVLSAIVSLVMIIVWALAIGVPVALIIILVCA
jgi:hypothetical protein